MSGISRRRRTRKKYLKLKKGGAWVSTLLFLGLSLLSIISSLIFLMVFTLFIIHAEIRNEYNAKSLLADLYDEGIGGEDPYLVFDRAGMDYFIRDKAGNRLHSSGEITCVENTGFTTIPEKDIHSGIRIGLNIHDGEDTVRMYADRENAVFRPDDEGMLDFDLKALWTLLRENIRNTDGQRDLRFPVWEEIPLHNGEQALVFKAVIMFRDSNFDIIMLMFEAMVLLITLILVAMILHAGSSAENREKIHQLLFNDIKVNGHNWMWFLYNSEQILRKHGSARKDFALVDLEFVGYRRYCICHSVDDGETRLQQIYQSLTKLVNKKELCAHSAEDSFALLLFCDGEVPLKKRLKYIVSELERISGSTIHAGAYIIRAAEKRWKDVDVERDYNCACAACSSLEGNEESREAIYDDKLLEEQRWVDIVQDAQQKAVDAEEFLVYYQPKYEPSTGVLCGAEALIRWQQPEYGFLPPYKFIPIFEKNGFITSIDHYMITHAARDQKRWLDEGRRCVPVSVNVSRAHFIESDLAEQIRDMVDREGTPHELIEIELTESAFFDDKKAIIQTINRLKSYGFSVSMDDFGSGYSSLNSLKDMPLDVLKLDAEFFRGEAAATERGEIIVSEAIRLAKSLNMRTVAEGIEARDQVDFLASQGCDMIQGYYFAKPMPAAEFLERMIAVRSDAL